MAVRKLYWIILFTLIYTTSKASFENIEALIFQDRSFKALEYIDSIDQNNDTLSVYSKAKLHLWKAEAYYQLDQHELFHESTLVADSLFYASDDVTSIDSLLYLLNYARYYHYLINPKIAHSYGKKAKRIFGKLPKNVSLKYAHIFYHTLGSYYRNKNRDTSLAYLNSALSYHKLYFGQSNYYRVIIHRSIANYYIDPVMKGKRDYSTAIHNYNEALKILNDYYPDNITDPSRIKSLVGLTYLYKNELDSAKMYFESVNDILESKMTNTQSVEKYASTYLTNIEWYRNCLERSEVFNDSIYLKAYLAKLRQAEEIYIKYSKINLNESCKCLLDIYRKTPYPSLVSISFQLWLLTNNRDYLEESLHFANSANHISFKQFVMSSTNQEEMKIELPKTSLNEFQRHIESDEVYLIYYDASDLIDYSFYAFLITKDKIIARKINRQTKDISNPSFMPILNKKSGKRFSSISSFKKYHFQVYKLLFEDFDKIISGNINTLKISANNRLSKVNFETLISDTLENDYRQLNYLIRKYNIAYASSIYQAYQQEGANKKIKTKKVFISPEYKDENLVNLENLNHKIKDWASLLSGEIFIDDSLTVEKIDETMKEASFIHLNGHVAHLAGTKVIHYLNDSINKVESHFKLSDAFNTSINNALVIHTACESGRGKPDRNALPLSFARAFLYSGAESVIYSKYPADENASIRFFDKFYQKISNSISPFKAFHQAKLHFIETALSSESANPYYWSTYQWLGKTDKSIHLKNSLFSSAIVGLSILTFFILVLLYYIFRKFFI